MLSIPTLTRLLAFSLMPVVFAGAASAQAPSEWRLSRTPVLEVGRAAIDLHRVAGAVVLPGGHLAIADAGNSRIVVTDEVGKLVRSIGREGEGPGEFRGLAAIAAFGDTLLGYDGLLSRIVVLLADGTHLGTRGMPRHGDSPVFFEGALSSSRYVGISPVDDGSSGGGLHRRDATIVVVEMGLPNRSAGEVRPLGRRQWQYGFTVVHGAGATRYRAPFLGQMRTAAVAGRIVVVARDGSAVEVLDPEGTASSRIAIPLARRPFDRSTVAAYRDSLLSRVRRSGRRFPGAAERIKAAFGDDFQVPPGELAPSVAEVAAAGGAVWLQSTEADEAAVTWIVLDPAAARIVARIRVPHGWNVLAGDGQRLVVHLRDAMGIELVRVYEILR